MQDSWLTPEGKILEYKKFSRRNIRIIKTKIK